MEYKIKTHLIDPYNNALGFLCKVDPTREDVAGVLSITFVDCAKCKRTFRAMSNDTQRDFQRACENWTDEIH